jgi:hypothetical protein
MIVAGVHPYRSEILASGSGNEPRRNICDTADGVTRHRLAKSEVDK